MTDEQLAPVLQGLYVSLRQHHEQILDLMHGFRALRETLQHRDSGFAAAYQKELDTRQAELERSKKQSLAALDQVLVAVRKARG